MAGRMMLVRHVTALCLFWPAADLARSQEQPPGDAAKVAELEKRVKDLEEIVRRLESNITQAQPLPVSLSRVSQSQPEAAGINPDQKVAASGIPDLAPAENP